MERSLKQTVAAFSVRLTDKRSNQTYNCMHENLWNLHRSLVYEKTEIALLQRVSLVHEELRASSVKDSDLIMHADSINKSSFN